MRKILSVIAALMLIVMAILAVPTLISFVLCALFSVPFAFKYAIAALVIQLWVTGIVSR